MLKFMLVRDFKVEKSEPYLSKFIYNAKNIIKKNTCFKNKNCFDL